MRNLIVLLGLFIFILMAGCASAPEVTKQLTGDYAWQGDVNPNEFDVWKAYSGEVTPQGGAWVYINNPNEESAVATVAMYLDFEQFLVAYRYWKFGVPYVIKYDAEKKEYVKVALSEAQIKLCYSCHNGRLEEKKQFNTAGGDDD